MKKESVSPILLVCRYKVHFFMLYTKVALGGAFIPYGNTYLWYIIMLFVFLSSIEDDEHLDRRITQGKILHDKKECCIQWKKKMLHSVKKRNAAFSEKRNAAFSEMATNRVCLVPSPTARSTSWGHDFTVKYLTYLYRAIDVSVLLGFVLYVLDLFQLSVELAKNLTFIMSVVLGFVEIFFSNRTRKVVPIFSPKSNIKANFMSRMRML